MPEAFMTIGGARVSADRDFEVFDPATGNVIGVAPDCGRSQLDEAFEAASAALPQWADDADARRAALRSAAVALRAAARGEIARTLTLEQGKPLREAGMELMGGAAWLQYFADLDLPREIIQDDPRGFVEVIRRPVGVVAAITPWNFPIFLACSKLGPALRAGNTVVLKPSPHTPLATLMLGQLLQDSLPAGVVNVVSGSDAVGEWMTGHPTPRKITLTGSVATGQQVARTSAADLKRLTLELGGNDAAIVLDDADPATTAQRLYASAFQNNGQVCSAVKRVYVARSRHGELVEALAALASGAVVGSGLDPETQLGPVTCAEQFDRVSGLVADALRAGGRAAAGGAPIDGPGFFYAPTVLDNVADGMAIVDSEQFGPALPVVAVDDIDDAVARANGTSYGLGGSVWSSDDDRAAAVAQRLECGTAWVNTHAAAGPHQPVGGVKWSGVGVENGRWGLESFTELQVLHRARA